jgi:uncharacterized protein
LPAEIVRRPAVRYPSLPYVLPFAIFVVFLAIQHYAPLPGHIDLIVRTVGLTAVLAIASRGALSFRTVRPLASVVLGVAVFAVWIAPDVSFPHYREHWLFQNRMLGNLSSSMPEDLRHDSVALVLRFLRAVALVPLIEELFWRGWLMRWLIHPDFEAVPLGAWAKASFWITALLFASEHGPYWDVGLMAGVLYNWWMINTKSLGDCILAHAVTNACLSAYVIATGQWQYWL